MPIKFSEFVNSLFTSVDDFLVGYNPTTGQNIRVGQRELMQGLGVDKKGYSLVGNLNGATLAAATTVYICPGITTTATIENYRKVVTSYGRVTGLYFRTSAAMTGVFTATVRKNGVDTLMTITIATGSAGALYTTTSNQFDVADGDEISIKLNQVTASNALIYGFGLIIK
jgi:hypothetical protein